jgi:hypothetical protein
MVLSGAVGLQSGATVWSIVHTYDDGVPAWPQRSAGVTTTVCAPSGSASHAGIAEHAPAPPQSSAQANVAWGSEGVSVKPAWRLSVRATGPAIATVAGVAGRAAAAWAAISAALSARS